LVHRIGVWGREVSYEERLARQARQLLQCYGIVTRESVRVWETGSTGDGEEGGLGWASLYAQFKLMEMRGEVRRGYFVQGLPGIQFALPEAVERLREWTRADTPDISDPGTNQLVLLNACDPANLFGPALAGTGTPDGEPERAQDPARFTRIPANYVVLLRGRPVLLLETGGGRLATLADPSDPMGQALPLDTLKQALRLALTHIGRSQSRLALGEWNGAPILESPAAPILEELGFRREALVYMWQSN
jgi:ATP-dependent Lhr-like helicase